MPGHQQMRQLMAEDVVDDVVGHALQPVRQPDAALGRGARAPARVLVGHPAHGGGHRPPVEVLVRQPPGTLGQLRVPERALALLGGQLVEHDVHPALLLRLGHPGGDEHHGAIALAVRGDRSASTGAPADLDRARPWAARRLARAALGRSGAVQWVGGHAPHGTRWARGSLDPGTVPSRSHHRAPDLYEEFGHLWTTFDATRPCPGMLACAGRGATGPGRPRGSITYGGLSCIRWSSPRSGADGVISTPCSSG